MTKLNVRLFSIVSWMAFAACNGDSTSNTPNKGNDDAGLNDTGTLPITGTDDTDSTTDTDTSTPDLNEAPTVLSTSPAAGATAVFNDEPIEIRFSEPMDPETVEVLSTFGDVVPVTWNDDFDVLTVSMKLKYAEGFGNHPELFEALAYTFTVNAGAADLDGEVIGEPTQWTFHTAIRMQVDVVPDLALTRTIMSGGTVHGQGGPLYLGDSGVLIDESMRGLVTFDLSELPEGAIVDSATFMAEQVSVVGEPYVYLGSIVAEQVSFSVINMDTWDTPATSYAALVSPSPTLELKAGDVSDIVADSVERRDELADRVQLMLRFSENAAYNGVGDTATLAISTVALQVNYLAE